MTKAEPCFALPDDPNYDGIWDWQWCTELLPQETYFSLSGATVGGLHVGHGAVWIACAVPCARVCVLCGCAFCVLHDASCATTPGTMSFFFYTSFM